MLNLRPILRLGARIASFRRKMIFESATADVLSSTAAVPVTFRYGDAADLQTLAAPEYRYDAAALRFGLERLRAGDRLVLGENAGRVVFYAWVMFGQMDMGLGEYAPLSSDRAYTYKLFTVADARGQGICPAYYVFLKRELRALGYRRVLAWVEHANYASIRAHTRAGFEIVGCIWHVRFLFRSYPLLRAKLTGDLPHDRQSAILSHP
jgi:ribosomal protein S18 acetylase RimI-like enzyme